MSRHGLHGFKKTRITRIVFLFSVFCSLFSVSYAQSITSAELITNAKDFDGKEIAYEGELVGDIMQRGNFVWLNINDGKNAIGINCHKEVIKNLDLFSGGYKRRGDWVEIKGVFSRNCKVHGGDLDIHAISINIIKKGKRLNEKINLEKKRLVFILTGVLLCLLILRLYQTRQRRRLPLVKT